MSLRNRGKKWKRKRVAVTQGKANAKKYKSNKRDFEWKFVEVDMPHYYREDTYSAVQVDEEYIDASYAFIHNNPVGIHLTLSNDGNLLRVFDSKDENRMKTWKHTLNERFDSCFLHNDLSSAILIRLYFGREKYELNNVTIAEVKHFLSSKRKIECNTLFKYNASNNIKNISHPIFKYRKSGHVLIVAMKQIKRSGTYLMIVTLNLLAKKETVWHDSETIESILYFDEYYLIAIVLGREGKIIKSMKLGDGKTQLKVIGTNKLKRLSAVYKIYLPQDSSADEVCVDSCTLKKSPDNLIRRWGENEGKLFASYGTENNLFILDKNKRLMIIDEKYQIVMIGCSDNPIYFSFETIFLGNINEFPDQLIVSNTMAKEEICIYDVETLRRQARLYFPYFPIWKIDWNSERSSFIATNSANGGDLYCIFKRVPKNKAK